MSDDPHQTAFNLRASAPERFDAQVALMQSYRPADDAVRAAIDIINDGLDQAELLKASNNILTFPSARGGYGKGTQGHRDNKRGMRSLYVDDLQVFASGDYFEKPSALGFDALRAMVEQVPILSAVVQTRIRQVNRYCNISEDGGPGFEIRHVDRKHILTAEEQTVTELLGRFMANCGWEFNARERKRLKRSTFQQMMAKSMRDSLSMDACPIETEWKKDRRLGLDGFYPVDGATIRLCMEDGYQGDDEIYALQVVNGRIVTAYTIDQLTYEVRNPRSDVRIDSYGLAEPETMIRIITGFLNAITYNTKGFDENSIPKGLLHLSGDYSQEDMGAFRRYWQATIKGVSNAHALPILVSKDQESKASFERFGVEFNDMYFAKWMTFLTAIVCSIYGMDPSEINFESFVAQKSSLSGNDTGERMAAAKDKGLRPFMAFYESLFTDFIVKEFADKYCFRWVGLEDEDEEKQWEAQKLTLTCNELRAENGYEPYPVGEDGLDLGAAPINPALISIWQAAVQPEPQEPGDEFGGPPMEQEDFGQVPGESQASGVPPNAKPKAAGEKDFGASMAKAFVYAMPEEE